MAAREGEAERGKCGRRRDSTGRPSQGRIRGRRGKVVLRAHRGGVDAEGVDRAQDVLQGERPQILGLVGEEVPHLLVHRARDRDPAEGRLLLQPGGDVHAVAVHAAVAGLDHVAQMHRHAHAQRRCLPGRDGGEGALHVERPADGIERAAELDEQPVPRPVHHAPAPGGHAGLDRVAAQRDPAAQRRALVRAHQARPARDVEEGDGGEAPFHALPGRFGMLRYAHGSACRCCGPGGGVRRGPSQPRAALRWSPPPPVPRKVAKRCRPVAYCVTAAAGRPP